MSTLVASDLVRARANVSTELITSKTQQRRPGAAQLRPVQSVKLTAVSTRLHAMPTPLAALPALCFSSRNRHRKNDTQQNQRTLPPRTPAKCARPSRPSQKRQGQLKSAGPLQIPVPPNLSGSTKFPCQSLPPSAAASSQGAAATAQQIPTAPDKEISTAPAANVAVNSPLPAATTDWIPDTATRGKTSPPRRARPSLQTTPTPAAPRLQKQLLDGKLLGQRQNSLQGSGHKSQSEPDEHKSCPGPKP